MKNHTYFFICFGLLALWVHAGESKSVIGVEIGTGKLYSEDYNMPFGVKLKGEHRVMSMKKVFMNAELDVEFGMSANKYRNEPTSDIIRGPDYVYRILQNYLGELCLPILGGNLEPRLGVGVSLMNDIESGAGGSNAFLYGGVLRPSFAAHFRSFSCSPFIRYQFLFGKDEDERRRVAYGSSLAYNQRKLTYVARAWGESNQYKTKSENWLTSSREPIWGVALGVAVKFGRTQGQ